MLLCVPTTHNCKPTVVTHHGCHRTPQLDVKPKVQGKLQGPRAGPITTQQARLCHSIWTKPPGRYHGAELRNLCLRLHMKTYLRVNPIECNRTDVQESVQRAALLKWQSGSQWRIPTLSRKQDHIFNRNANRCSNWETKNKSTSSLTPSTAVYDWSFHHRKPKLFQKPWFVLKQTRKTCISTCFRQK